MPNLSKREQAEQKAKAERRKRAMAIGLSVMAGVVLAGGVYYWWASSPPGLPDDLDEAVGVYESVRYANVPESRKSDYALRVQTLLAEADDAARQRFFDRMGDSEEARREAWDTHRALLVTRARRYALADEAERAALREEMRAEWERMREQFRQRREEREEMTDEERASRREQWQSEMRERMAEGAASGNPQDRQLVGAMMRDMWGGGRGRGGD